MKDGTHGNPKIDELSAFRILCELREKSQKDTDGKVHIREIKDGHIGETVESY